MSDPWPAQPALFLFEYALAQFWIGAGIEPSILLGHSLGELTAAAVADVIGFEEALKIIVKRARIIEHLAPGAMIAVCASAAEVEPLLAPGLDLAAANSSVSCTVAGPEDALRSWTEGLSARRIAYQPIANGSLIHTPAAAPTVAPVRSMFEQAKLRSPRYPIISARSGRQLSDADARDPGYWAAQLTAQVGFEQAVRALVPEADLLLEIGPAETLSAFAIQTMADVVRGRTVASFPSPLTGGAALDHLLGAAGRLWAKGAPLRRERLSVAGAKRVPLPTYPFEGPRFAEPHLAITTASTSGAGARQRGAPIARTVLPPARDVDAATADTEAILAEIWRDVLKADEIRPTDSFRALGGDSLLALRLAAAVRHAFDIDLKVVELWAQPTLQEQAAFVLGRVVETMTPSGSPGTGDQPFAAERGDNPALSALGPDLDRVAHGLVRSALPWLTDGDDVGLDALAAANGVSPDRRRFVRHWRGLSSRHGPAVGGEHLAQALQLLHQRTHGTAYAPLAAAVEAIGKALPDIVSGHLSGAEILLSPADDSLAEQLYRSLPESGASVRHLTRLAETAFETLDVATLHCLEVGGGFGVATDALLPALRARPHRYVFTDVSTYFLERMRVREPALECAIFDIDHAPSPAIGLDRFDVAIAANVLHCARHVRDALLHVRSALRPGGYLVLVEMTAAADWHGLTMGVLEGFLSFDDDRTATPLLSVEDWATCLTQAGFALISVLPEGAEGEMLGQHAMLARRMPL
jgi:acyl transferase domain-containing protein